MTFSEENYLKAIYHLTASLETEVSTNAIAEMMETKASSVTDMLKKLSEKDLVNYKKYQGVSLTENGKLAAKMIVRKHRLWEVFLVNYLGYAWNEVHEEAEVLEHVTSIELARRLDKYLDFPKVCPHGGMIPTETGVINEKVLPTLVDKQVYDVIKIKRVVDEKELLDYLASLELAIGDVYKIIDIGAYEGPITLEAEGKQVALSYKAATSIFIE